MKNDTRGKALIPAAAGILLSRSIPCFSSEEEPDQNSSLGRGPIPKTVLINSAWE